MKILLVEDDIQLNTTISNFLKLKDFEVISLCDGDKAIDLIDEIKFDLFIIDINIPNVNGLELVQYIRNKSILSPVIIITASLELENFKKAFENGCNEYIKKPFYLEELEIRIDNLLKKEEQIIEITENMSYDIEYEELIKDEEVVKLRKKERRLLTILLQNMNKVVSTEAIENYVWENEVREVYPLRQLLSEIRKKVDDKEFIKSAKGLGYKIEIKR